MPKQIRTQRQRHALLVPADSRSEKKWRGQFAFLCKGRKKIKFPCYVLYVNLICSMCGPPFFGALVSRQIMISEKRSFFPLPEGGKSEKYASFPSISAHIQRPVNHANVAQQQFHLRFPTTFPFRSKIAGRTWRITLTGKCKTSWPPLQCKKKNGSAILSRALRLVKSLISGLRHVV